MDDGIYSIIFKSSIGELGGGLVVIDEGKIHGGNVKYIIKGFYNKKGNAIESQIKVEHYQGPLDSVFGEIDEYSLILSGKSEPESFQLTGHMKEKADMKIEVEGIKVSDLAE
ncbi:MAG: hypothetical protein PVG39_11055 [Desulfobacteraceae bacterium]|jgi:hypothetical protein